MCSEVTGTDTVHEWNEWVGVMEANDSELVTFYSTLYLSATIAIVTLPARFHASAKLLRGAGMTTKYPYKFLHKQVLKSTGHLSTLIYLRT